MLKLCFELRLMKMGVDYFEALKGAILNQVDIQVTALGENPFYYQRLTASRTL